MLVVCHPINGDYVSSPCFELRASILAGLPGTFLLLMSFQQKGRAVLVTDLGDPFALLTSTVHERKTRFQGFTE